MDMLAVYLGHHLGLNLSKDIRPLYNFDTHTTIMEIHIHFIREGKIRGIFPDAHINGTMKLTLDNGWDWIQIDLDSLSEKDIELYRFRILTFVKEIRESNPEMFAEFDPSERYD